MRNPSLMLVTVLFLLSACNGAKKPSDANFTAAINQYLETHGQACSLIGPSFPIDLPRSQSSNSPGTGAKLEALRQAGLVSATDTMAVVHGMLDALRGSTPAQPVRRYTLTAEGQTYFREIPASLGSTSAFCYGQKAVDSIVQYAQSQTNSTQAEATYTYKIINLAQWAERPDVQQAFSDIQATVNGASKVHQIIGLQLTDKGWTVPGT